MSALYNLPMTLTDEQLAKLAVKIAAMKDQDIEYHHDARYQRATYTAILDSGSSMLGNLTVTIDREPRRDGPGWRGYKYLLRVKDGYGWYLVSDSSPSRVHGLYERLAERHSAARQQLSRAHDYLQGSEALEEFVKFLER